ncbi:hypothetical protein DPMN_003216 [Dreissena polymorpha]|nr:hypothetical protein DPMN_003195 [Dreissena polymorpha]KAH3879314.1 hypothetical protein DPMN_003216 [Dreissena polymorpha]
MYLNLVLRSAALRGPQKLQASVCTFYHHALLHKRRENNTRSNILQNQDWKLCEKTNLITFLDVSFYSTGNKASTVGSKGDDKSDNTTADDRKDEVPKSETYRIIYSYPGIKSLEFIQKMRRFQIVIVTIGIPVMIFSGLPVVAFMFSAALFGFSTNAIWLSANKAECIIARMYVDDENEKVKLSFVDRKWKRLDVYKNKADIIPVTEISDNAPGKKYFVIETKQKDVYFLPYLTCTDEERDELKKVIGDFSSLLKK